MALSPTKAFDVQAQVVAQVARQRGSWVALAERLYEFHAGEGWLALDPDSTFHSWLGMPEISLSRTSAHAMIGAWLELFVKRNVDPTRLATLDISKVAVVLPAIRDGHDLGETLADCEQLSRSDLRALYQSSEHAEYRLCEACGQKVKVTA